MHPLYFRTEGFDAGTEAAGLMRGTTIETPDGVRPVQDLERGDHVLTCDGHAVPTLWIWRQTVSRLFGDPLITLPIRIKAGALADNVPDYDLCVSPFHAILIGHTMVQAGALVNGQTIVRDAEVPVVFTYYNIELDAHALVLAEKTPAETFVNNISRQVFDNWEEYNAIFPDGKQTLELPFPRARSHRQVPRQIRERIAARRQFDPTGPVRQIVL